MVAFIEDDDYVDDLPEFDQLGDGFLRNNFEFKVTGLGSVDSRPGQNVGWTKHLLREINGDSGNAVIVDEERIAPNPFWDDSKTRKRLLQPKDLKRKAPKPKPPVDEDSMESDIVIESDVSYDDYEASRPRERAKYCHKR